MANLSSWLQGIGKWGFLNRNRDDRERLLRMIAEQLKYENAETIRRWQQDQEDRDARLKFRQNLNGLLGEANGLVARVVDARRPEDLAGLWAEVVAWTKSAYQFAMIPPACHGATILRGLPIWNSAPESSGEVKVKGWTYSASGIRAGETVDRTTIAVDPEKGRQRMLAILETVSERLVAFEARMPFP